MFKLNDKVFVELSAERDVGFMAWSFVKAHPQATVKCGVRFVDEELQKKLAPGEEVYAVEWEESFPGGHDCHKACLPGHGQFVAGKHLSLRFEESREVNTVPQIGTPV